MPRARNEAGGWDLRKIPPIILRRLGQHEAAGLARHPLFAEIKPMEVSIQVEIEERNRARMEFILHEAAHIAFPGLPEETVEVLARFQAKVLWHMGYRADDDAMDIRFKGDKPDA
jgi:hypothetical protein